MQNRAIDPATLKITDMRFADIDGAPKRCTLLKLYTNQGLVGYGEVRDASSKTYALMLKSRLLGENPCNVDRIMHKIKQFGGPSRQGGGVSGVEIALWDLAGKAWGVPVWQLLGGKYRDKIRVYCDTDADGKDNTGHAMGLALKKRLEMGFTFLKMDLGIGILMDKPGTLCAPLGFLDDMKQYAPHILNVQGGSVTADMVAKQESYSIVTTAHPFTGIHITEKGLDVLEQYVREVREVIGYEVPLAIDHFGHVCVEDCIRFARRMEPYNIAWMEDMVPWIYPDQLARLRSATTIPVCTGEDIYLKEGFAELFKKQAVSVIHPDILTCGGALELKKIADMADENGVAVAIHMAESPIAALAAVHTAAAMHNVLAMELHSVDIPWWQDLVNGPQKPFVKDGFITVPDAPGLGIESLNEALIAEHINPSIPGLWEPTDEWNTEFSNDRIWS
ncbi:MAG: mandelate racemase/muconate lactonizing enzyme family protein [Clostridiales bacterium]|nr:mandelate racemase/muconate lactonizing enzyme family protein [Clostridiales bacterium]MDY5348572.1 mandelate racemase/muconate lactonizing enzyme family protein [Candidatus Ventricola sp.]MDY5515275.1 mandelate racemase/muconate lactonizing enzyme family protein [Candidatus Ventricola sp.]